MKKLIIAIAVVILLLALVLLYQPTEKTIVQPPDRTKSRHVEIELNFLKESGQIPTSLDKDKVINLMPEAIDNYEKRLHGVYSLDSESINTWPQVKDIATKVAQTKILPPRVYLEVMTFDKQSFPKHPGPRLDMVVPYNQVGRGFQLPLVDIETRTAYDNQRID